MCFKDRPKTASETFRACRKHYLSYADMRGRATKYMVNGRLPPIFKDLERWPTHAPGKPWTTEALLDILAQTIGGRLPHFVPRKGSACFEHALLTDKCMVATKVSSCSPWWWQIILLYIWSKRFDYRRLYSTQSTAVE